MLFLPNAIKKNGEVTSNAYNFAPMFEETNPKETRAHMTQGIRHLCWTALGYMHHLVDPDAAWILLPRNLSYQVTYMPPRFSPSFGGILGCLQADAHCVH